MCNAHNHPRNCTCGWGGVSYAPPPVAYGLNVNKSQMALRSDGLQIGTTSRLAGGWVNPNASCPVCGASVYYYQSASGGRVFFDELGPPWPKHPCTSGTTYISNPAQASAKDSPHIETWSNNSWRPLTSVAIYLTPGAEKIYKITGLHENKSLTIFIYSTTPLMAEIVRFRVIQPGLFEISILDYFYQKNEWIIWNGIAAFDDRKLVKPLTKTVMLITVIGKSDSENKNTSDFTACPVCKVELKTKSLKKHLTKIHGICEPL